MKTITKQFNVYSFSELSDKAKEKVCQQYSEDLDDYWSEWVIEDAKAVASLMGWDLTSIYFSGFWSQGDGACFVGTMRYAKDCENVVKHYAPTDEVLHAIAKDWKDLQSKNFYSLTASVTKSYHQYSHENTVSFECEDERNPDRNLTGIENEIAEIGKRFMRWVYKKLEEAYEYEVSEENISEMGASNGWVFLEDGTYFVE